MANSAEWCLIESDPAIFSELIKDMGVDGIRVKEIISLDSEQFAQYVPVYGLIFLFKWRSGEEISGQLDYDSTGEVFFAQQVITNACASQAIINILMNINDDSVQLGEELEGFKNFTMGFDPANKGLCLSNAETIRRVHNSFARQQGFELDLKGPSKEDNFHFIAYVPVNGRIYELDGLREAPIDLGPTGDDWLEPMLRILTERIDKYQEGEIHFNLMAVCQDPILKLQHDMDDFVKQCGETTPDEEVMSRYKEEIAHEEEEWLRDRRENVRRRHNYVPFIVELLKVLAKENMLVDLVDDVIGSDKSSSSR